MASLAGLTPDQRTILLRLCNAAELGRSVKLIASRTIRETSTGAALVRKGLARRLRCGRFEATDAGFWLGDGLRLEVRRRASSK